ncbi:MAG: amidohydrolase, partial [bacterium]
MKDTAILIFGGRIYTMSDRLPVADALIVRGERIAWIGSAADLSAVPADSFEMIDLQGGIVLPGFVDSHVHLFHWSRSLSEVKLGSASSYDEVLRHIRKYVRKNPTARWLGGGGWKIEQWRRPHLLHKDALDHICSDKPLVFFSKDDHTAWVNSRTLQLAGIGPGTPDPPGGVIERDEFGQPTGILREQAAWQLYKIRPQSNPAEARKTLKQGIAEMLRRGCVGVSNFDKSQGWETLEALDIAGELPIRVTQYFSAELLAHLIQVGLKTGFGSAHLKVGGVKLFADGALGSQTALMLKPFVGSKSSGVEVTSADELKRLIKKCTRHGLSCAVHAIGDRANRNVLDAIAAAQHLSRRFRHRIEHCQIVSPADVKRFAELGVIASMQPTHATADIDLMRLYLGKRAQHSYRFR